MALYGALDIFFSSARLEIQIRIHGVEFEEIPVRLAWRRARTSITDFSKIVAALN